MSYAETASDKTATAKTPKPLKLGFLICFRPGLKFEIFIFIFYFIFLSCPGTQSYVNMLLMLLSYSLGTH